MILHPFTNLDSSQIITSYYGPTSAKERDKASFIIKIKALFHHGFDINSSLLLARPGTARMSSDKKHCLEETFNFFLTHACLCIFFFISSVLHDYFCSQALPNSHVIHILGFPVLATHIISSHLWQTNISTYCYCKVIIAN